MCVKHLLIFFVISFASRGHSYENGYSLSTCDDLKPNQEPNEHNISAANSGIPFDITVTSPKYRRNRVLEVVIKGKTIEGFQLQFRKYVRSFGKPTRVGEFEEELPKGTSFLQCDGDKNTAVTHTDLEQKTDLKFKWRAPEECEDTIKLNEGFVSKQGVYWKELTDIKLECAELPVSLKDCGDDKSCIHYSPYTKNCACDGNTCNYLLTYEISGNDIKFSLSALSDDLNSYSAVGFSEKEDGKIDLIACVRENDEVSIKHYVRKAEKQPLTEGTINIEGTMTDKEDNNFWCSFTLPVKDAGSEPLDFNENLYWIYAWGKVNETSHLPILGKNWHQSQHNGTVLLNATYCTDGSTTTTSVTGFMLVSLPLLLLMISQL